jgi:polyhydroxyalkanoate synthesis repressor PhaR
MLIKKYANRRLYDATTSAYVTLEDVAARIRAGEDVVVVDAQSGADLTQATLVQIILEGRGMAKLLPVPMLLQLVRLGDDALGEFFGRWMGWALDAYVQGRERMLAWQQWNPFAAPGAGFPWSGRWPGGAAPGSGFGADHAHMGGYAAGPMPPAPDGRVVWRPEEPVAGERRTHVQQKRPRKRAKQD